MNYKIYVVGKITSKAHKAAIAEYEKRLSRYCKIKLFEEKNIENVLKKLIQKSYVIRIKSDNKTLSSEHLAEKINHLGVMGQSDISIVFTEEEIPCDEVCAVSSLDLSVGLFSVVIFEQIYRGYRILKNEPYHK